MSEVVHYAKKQGFLGILPPNLCGDCEEVKITRDKNNPGSGMVEMRGCHTKDVTKVTCVKCLEIIKQTTSILEVINE